MYLTSRAGVTRVCSRPSRHSRKIKRPNLFSASSPFSFFSAFSINSCNSLTLILTFTLKMLLLPDCSALRAECTTCFFPHKFPISMLYLSIARTRIQHILCDSHEPIACLIFIENKYVELNFLDKSLNACPPAINIGYLPPR